MTVAKKYADQTFTRSEYLALPENERMEILEGCTIDLDEIFPE